MGTITAASEEQRLEALRRYRILDTPPEPAFDDLTKLAAQICGTPKALISLVDEHRVWLKAATGMEVGELDRLPRCGHALSHRR